MVQLTPVAITKVKEILTQQNPSPTGLRVAVVGGGCSGFSYHMAFENQVNQNSDNIYEFDGLKVLVDQMSEMYLDGVQLTTSDSRRFGLQVQQPERQEHLRLRQLLQRLTTPAAPKRALRRSWHCPYADTHSSRRKIPSGVFFARANGL